MTKSLDLLKAELELLETEIAALRADFEASIKLKSERAAELRRKLKGGAAIRARWTNSPTITARAEQDKKILQFVRDNSHRHKWHKYGGSLVPEVMKRFRVGRERAIRLISLIIPYEIPWHKRRQY